MSGELVKRIEEQLRASLMESFEGKYNDRKTAERVRQSVMHQLTSLIHQGYIPPMEVTDVTVKPNPLDSTIMDVELPEELVRKLYDSR